MRRLAILMAICAAVSACGGGRFGGAASRATAPAADPRPLIETVESADIVPTQSGVVLRATGIAPVQGYWEGALVREEMGDPSVLAFAFRAAQPTGPTRISTQRSREITVARTLSPSDLAGIREIRVVGAATGRVIRR